MSFIQAMEAATTGFGTTKLSGANIDDTALLTALGLTYAALDTRIKGLDIQVIAGPIYIENDGTAADANTTQLDVGQTYRVRNCRELLSLLHIFSAGAYDLRVALWG